VAAEDRQQGKGPRRGLCKDPMSNLPTDQVATIEISGAFDVDSALGVAEQVGQLPLGCEACIDLVRARPVLDHALLALVQALQDQPGAAPVRLRGLSGHHLRILSYLGVSPGELGLAPARAGDED
jgi:hypothetical protein